MLELKALGKNYGKAVALVEVDLRVDQGETVAIVGPEGSGKSTLFAITSGLIEPSTGDVVLDDRPLSDNPLALRRIVGFVPQSEALYPSMLVYDFLCYVGRLKSVRRSALRGWVREIGEKTGIAHVMAHPIAELAPVLKRRCAIAQSLLGSPKLVLLDDPLLGFEGEERAGLTALIKTLASDTTLCLATNHLEEAAMMADRLVFMAGGRVVGGGTKEELLAAEAAVSRFLLVAKGPKAEELGAVLEQIEGVKDTAPISTRQTDTVGMEVTTELDEGMKDTLRTAVTDADWEVIRIGRKSLDFQSIYGRLTGASNG